MLTTAGGALPPKNFYGFSMENFGSFPSTEIFFFGDIRGNENPGKSCIYIYIYISSTYDRFCFPLLCSDRLLS